MCFWNEAAEDHRCKISGVRAELGRWLHGQTLACMDRRQNWTSSLVCFFIMNLNFGNGLTCYTGAVMEYNPLWIDGCRNFDVDVHNRERKFRCWCVNSSIGNGRIAVKAWGYNVAWSESFDRDMTGRRRLGRLDNEASIRGRIPPRRRWQLLRYCHVRSNWGTGKKHVNRNHSRHCPLNVGIVFEIELHNECFRIRYPFVRMILTGWLKQGNTRETWSR
jgi:hypothetical protein